MKPNLEKSSMIYNGVNEELGKLLHYIFPFILLNFNEGFKYIRSLLNPNGYLKMVRGNCLVTLK